MSRRAPRSWTSLLLGAVLALCACDTLKSEPDPAPPLQEEQEQTPDPELRVSVKTEGPEYCRQGLWTLTVSIEGGTPDWVGLVRSGYGAIELPLSNQYLVNCDLNAEGRYTFIVQAALKEKYFTSTPVSVVVDRTPPRIESWLPKEHYPSVDAPVEVIFSEPLRPESLQLGPTLLRDDKGFMVPHTATLSEDGRALRLVPSSPLRLPVTLYAELVQHGMTDLAGNPLLPEASAARYQWQVAYWPFAQVGAPVSGRSTGWMAFDTGPEPVAALIEYDSYDPTDRGELFVQRMKGEAWERLPEPRALPSRSMTPMNPKLQVLGGKVVLAWAEDPPSLGGKALIHVSRFEGGAWTLLGTPLETGSPFIDFGMALDSGGDPVLVYGESEVDLRVARWTGTAWELLGGPLRGNAQAVSAVEYPSIAVDSSRVVVAWSESPAQGLPNHVFVREYRSGSWAPLGPPLRGSVDGGTHEVVVALGRAADSPFVAWTEHGSSSRNGFVYASSFRQDGSSGSWAPPEPVLEMSQLFGGVLRGLWLLMDSSQEPWVVATRSTSNITTASYFRRHRATGWEPEQLIGEVAIHGVGLDEEDTLRVAAGDVPHGAVLRPQ